MSVILVVYHPRSPFNVALPARFTAHLIVKFVHFIPTFPPKPNISFLSMQMSW